MNKKYVLIQIDSQKDGRSFHVMEQGEAEKKVYEWNRQTGGPACTSRIIYDLSHDIRKILNVEILRERQEVCHHTWYYPDPKCRHCGKTEKEVYGR